MSFVSRCLKQTWAYAFFTESPSSAALPTPSPSTPYTQTGNSWMAESTALHCLAHKSPPVLQPIRKLWQIMHGCAWQCRRVQNASQLAFSGSPRNSRRPPWSRICRCPQTASPCWTYSHPQPAWQHNVELARCTLGEPYLVQHRCCSCWLCLPLTDATTRAHLLQASSGQWTDHQDTHAAAAEDCLDVVFGLIYWVAHTCILKADMKVSRSAVYCWCVAFPGLRLESSSSILPSTSRCRYVLQKAAPPCSNAIALRSKAPPPCFQSLLLPASIWNVQQAADLKLEAWCMCSHPEGALVYS